MKLRRKYRFIVFYISDEDEIDVEHLAEPSQTMEDLQACLPFSDCRYAVYDHEYTTFDGRKTSKLLFITWLPLNSTSHAKMAYTSGKGVFKESNYLQGVEDVNAITFDDVRQAVNEGGDVSDDDSDISDF